VPTHKAYRLYVDSLVQVGPLAQSERDRLSEQLAGASTIEAILRRAAQSLGVLTQELGVAVGPHFEQATLRQIDLVRLSSDRLLAVLTLDHGAVRTVFVEVPGVIADEAVREVARVLNERLAGLSLRELRVCVAERLRDARPAATAPTSCSTSSCRAAASSSSARPATTRSSCSGSRRSSPTSPSSRAGPDMRRLLELTETREELAGILAAARAARTRRRPRSA
jgi:heat-inducible transcriptional repressor